MTIKTNGDYKKQICLASESSTWLKFDVWKMTLSTIHCSSEIHSFVPQKQHEEL